MMHPFKPANRSTLSAWIGRLSKDTQVWKKRARRLRLAAAVAASVSLALSAESAWAQTTWVGGSGNSWFTGANWDTNAAPNGITTNVVVGAPAPTVIDGNVNINSLTVDAAGQITLNGNLNLDFGGTAATTLNNAGTITTLNNTDMQLARGVFNSGSINVTSTGNLTDLEVISAGATLSGGGTISLTANSARIMGLAGAMLNIDDQTIQGYGQIGANTLGLTNSVNSLINANSNGNILVLDPSAAGNMINQGTLRASDGGVLELSGIGGNFNNTGGTIEALNGSTVRLSNASILGGTVATTGNGVISGVASTTNRLENVTIAGNLQSLNNSALALAGSITNTGSIAVSNTGNLTAIEVQTGGVTLDGGGTVTLGGTSNFSTITGVSGSQTLTIANQTIQGQGQLGANAIGIVNQAGNLIDANVDGQTLTIDPSVAGGVTNTGTMQASNGGTLQLNGANGGDFNNTGGLIVAQDGSTIQLSNATVIGGTLATSGTGVISNDGSANSLLQDLTVAGNLQSLNNSDLGVAGTITNTGSITATNTGNLTSIEVQSGGATLTGGGTITLDGTTNNSRIDGVAGGHTLTIADQTIQGHGQIGANTIGIVNQAGNLIDANVAGRTLTIDPSTAAGVTNTGTMQASNGGTLQLIGSDFNNTGGMIEAQDGSTVQLSSATVIGGTLATSGTGVISNDASANSLLQDLTVVGNLQSLNNSDLGVAGTINNTGSITATNTGNLTSIEVQSGGATLTGGGTITLGGTTDNSRIDGVAGGHTLTIADQTIQGHGQIGANTIGIVNQAGNLIDANVAGRTLTIDPSAAESVRNSGTMQASNGGTLQLNGSGFNNTGGLIEAQEGSTVQLSSATVIGGTLATSGTGIISNDASADSLLQDLTVAGNLQSLNNSDLGVAGTINNTGSITVTNTGNLTDIEVQAGGATLTGGGTITLGGSLDNSRINGVSGEQTLTIADQTIQGYGQIGANSIGIVNGTDGVIHANSIGSALTIDPSLNRSFVNEGIVRASGGGELVLTGSGLGTFAGDGVYEALDGGLIRVDSSASISSAIGGALIEGTWRAIDEGNGAAIRLQNNLISAPNTIGANAIVELSGVNSGFTFTGSNTPIDASLNNVEGSLSLLNGRTMALTGGLTSVGDITLVGASTALTVNGDFNQSAGLTQLVNGATLQLQGANNLFSGGMLAGNGTVDGSFTLGSGAILSPGLSPGQIDIDGDFTWAAGGQIEFDLGATAFDSDFVSVFGDFLKPDTGTFAFNFIDNGWVVGQTYDLIEFGSTNFQLDDFSFSNANGFSGQFVYSGGGDRLQFTISTVPEPGAVGVLIVLGALCAMHRRRKASV